MKRLIRCGTLALLAAGLLLAGQWTGWVTDDKCAANGQYEGAMHRQCVKSGAALVFVNEADKKMFKIKDGRKVERFVGQKVMLSGTAEGDVIEVDTITPVTQ